MKKCTNKTVNQKDDMGQTALHLAASEDMVEVLDDLIKKKAKIDAKDNYGRTALHCAANFQCYKCMEKLIEAKANLHAVTNDKNSLLSILVSLSQKSETKNAIIEKILPKGLDKENSDKETPLDRACLYGTEDVVRIILKYEPDINHASSRGETPLHLAVQRKHRAIIKLLLDSKADVTIKSHSGITPAEAARLSNDNSLAALIENHNLESIVSGSLTFSATRVKIRDQPTKGRRKFTKSQDSLGSSVRKAPKRSTSLRNLKGSLIDARNSFVSASSNSPPGNKKSPIENNTTETGVPIQTRVTRAATDTGGIRPLPSTPEKSTPSTPADNSDADFVRSASCQQLKRHPQGLSRRAAPVRPTAPTPNEGNTIVNDTKNATAPRRKLPPPPVPARKLTALQQKEVRRSRSLSPERRMSGPRVSGLNNKSTVAETSSPRKKPQCFQSTFDLLHTPVCLSASTPRESSQSDLLFPDSPNNNMELAFSSVNGGRKEKNWNIEALKQDLERRTSFCITEMPDTNYRESCYLVIRKLQEAQLPHNTITIPPEWKMRQPPEHLTASKLLGLWKTFEELLYTENQYVRQLGTLILVYKRPIEMDHSILPKEDSDGIFNNWEDLFHLSSNIFNLLRKEETKEMSERRVGAIFVKFVSQFSAYNKYCTNQTFSAAALEDLRSTRKKFREFLEAAREQEDSCFEDVRGFLIKPFQRVCRYVLLLKEIARQMPEDWADYPNIQDAIERIDAIVRQANETKRVMDNEIKMQAIRQNLDIKLNSSLTVKFVNEGDFKQWDHGKLRKRHFFLFNGLLLITKKNTKGKHFAKEYIPVENCIIGDKNDIPGYPDAFQVVRTDSTEIIVFVCPTTALKHSWMNNMNNTVSTAKNSVITFIN